MCGSVCESVRMYERVECVRACLRVCGVAGYKLRKEEHGNNNRVYIDSNVGGVWCEREHDRA